MSPFRKVVIIINIWLKPDKKRIINCHDLKAVAIQVVVAHGFSQNILFYEAFRIRLNYASYISPGFMSPLVSQMYMSNYEVIKWDI